jgi:SAM-dependent methyltransferase
LSNRSYDQDSVFVKTEGDAWYRRNADVISSPAIREGDLALGAVLSIHPPIRRVLEVGCATGWRLDAIRANTGAICVGVDVSEEALRAGKRQFSGLMLLRARASALPVGKSAEFDAVIASFLFHWIDRRLLLRSAAEIDRCVASRGRLVIADFFPPEPTKVPYHHLRGSGIYTYKQDYSALFTASGTYRLERAIVFDHDNPANHIEVASFDDERISGFDVSSRAAVWVLKKDPAGYYSLPPSSPSGGAGGAGHRSLRG